MAMVFYRRFNASVMCMNPIKEADLGTWTDAGGKLHKGNDPNDITKDPYVLLCGKDVT